MKMNLKTMAVAAFAATLLITGCKKDPVEEPNEEELITTMKVTLTPAAGGTAQTFTFTDLDGDGGAVPTQFDTIRLGPSRVYAASITFTNEAVNPAEDITTEVSTEGGDHQIYFVPTGANVTVTNLNNDAGGLPLGLTSTWTTTTASTGKLQITLKHKPGQKAAGDPITKGETDIDLPWNVKIQ